MQPRRTLFAMALLAVALLATVGAARAASTLYAATKIGPFKSTDSGVTWKQLIVTTNDPSLPGLAEIIRHGGRSADAVDGICDGKV